MKAFMAKSNSISQRAKKVQPPSPPHTVVNGGSSNGMLELISRVTAGLEEQNSSLDAITGETNELASSLKETANLVGSVANSSADTASALNQVAALRSAV